MITVTVHNNGIITELKTETGSTLLNTLRINGMDIYSPCGGNGTCGKCNVMVKDTGLVPSCSYIIKENIEVILPDKREAKVLVEQHRHTVVLPLLPGNASYLSVYPHGVAADIGTTTIVLYLVNLVTGVITDTRAILNPQAKYGADVITRIQFSTSHPGGLEILHNELIAALNKELKAMTRVADISENELVRFVFAGNTTMLHLLLKISPKQLALYPFKPEFIDEQILNASELELKAFSEAEVKVLPSVAAFVGADIVAGLASIAPDTKYRKYLFMDIGTNGELALITENEVLCCSTAAGPAFEGAKISCGMGAVTGAISAFGDNGITVIGDEKPTGICGSGLIDIVAWLLGNNKLNNEGQLKEDFVVVPESKSGTGTAITITQNDIREVQLAKSAIASGLKILLKQAGMSFEELDALFLAGGFGNYINTGSAIRIGLLPEKMQDKIITLGNTSGTGAILALKSVKFDEIIKILLSKTRHVELASDEDFELEFAMNMFF